MLEFFTGVPLFFFISGYLIRFSIKNTKNTKDFFKKRFLRIYPELWAGVLIEIMTILIFYKGQIHWLLLGLFAITQGTVLQFWTPEFLRGYGCGTPNGSLWTICVTIQFYILSWMTQKLWIKRRLWFWISSTALFMILGACTGVLEGKLPILGYKLYRQTIIPYWWIFWIGIGTAEYADNFLPVLKKYWWLFVGIFFVWNEAGIDVKAGNYPILAVTVSCFGCLGLAYAFPKLNIRTDISYAMFIYHMIFVNIMIAVGWMGIKGMAAVTVVTLIVSYLSTIFIGKIVLKKVH